MKKLFDEKEISESRYKALFVERNQKPNESIQQYFVEVKDLAEKAFPGVPKNKIKEYTKTQFVQGLENKEVRNRLLLDHKEKNLDQVCVIAEEINNTLTSDQPSRAENKQVRFETTRSNYTNQGNNERHHNNRNYQNNRPKGCWKCGEMGHRGYECPKGHNQNQQNSGSSQNLTTLSSNMFHISGQMNALTMDSRTLETLKEISGFCKINDRTVNFLLDTGCFRTFVNKRTLNQTELAQINNGKKNYSHDSSCNVQRADIMGQLRVNMLPKYISLV